MAESVNLPPIYDSKVIAVDDPAALDVISLEKVAQNESWMVIYDKVYDLTEFFHEHPGGAEVLMENGGRDASNQFRSVGHSDAALKMLEQFLVGILPQDERMWDTPPLTSSI